MDWHKITDTLIPYVNKAKEYGQKATKFAEDQIQTTPLFIKTQAEYEDLITSKRVVIVAYDENQEDIAREIRLLSTIWLTRAFMDAAKLRFIALNEPTEFIHNLALTKPLDMRVRFEGKETFFYSDISEIKNWWKFPIYTSEKTEDDSKNTVPIDPLAGK